jgi:hypothetical protein
VQNQHRVDIGNQLGLPGVAAARLDVHRRQPLNAKSVTKAIALYNKSFSGVEFVKNFVADVNQQDPKAERFILPKTLYDWAAKGHGGFEPHTVLYDEDNAEAYDGAAPATGNEYSAFIHDRVALEIMDRLF